MRRKHVVLLLLIGMFILSYSSMLFSNERKAKNKEEYVGAETCKGCHEGYYDSYSKSLHAKKGNNKESC